LVFFGVALALATLFLLSGLAALLGTLTALPLLTMLSGLAALLLVLLHIVCHEIFLQIAVQGFPRSAIFDQLPEAWLLETL
jgi:hypothetical protein